MSENGLKELDAFRGLNDLPDPYRERIAELRMYRKYLPPEKPLLFTREEVLDSIRQLPHTLEEFRAAMEREEKYHEGLKGKPGESREEDGPPFVELGGHSRFLESAAATLTEADLPTLREARRKAIHGISDESLYEFFAYSALIQSVVNRLDLYRDYRPR